jgi:hypothetical protein
MRVRMKIPIGGGVSVGPGVGVHDLQRSNIVEVSDAIAAQWVQQGYAERRLDGPIGRAYEPEAAPNW